MSSNREKRFMEGNIAIAEGALAAGARFYAGYPITPSSEIAEYAARQLPRYEGIYVQMEDEIGSIAALIGASAAGAKVFTATSGPGFSLMQENIGLAIMAETPMVIVNVQRCGPSTGAATKPAQGDVMQARWGTHGDHSMIALSPSSVQDCFDLTIKAFNLAEKYRTPVVLLADEVVGHLRETAEVYTPDVSEIINRRKPQTGLDPIDFRSYDYDGDLPAPMTPFGSPYLSRFTGSVHDEKGEYKPSQPLIDKVTRYLVNKIEQNSDDIVMTREYYLEDADTVFISYGCSVRSALGAMEILRAAGQKVGLLQLITIWPLAEQQIRQVLARVKCVVVPELNLGQLVGEIRKLNDYQCRVIQVNRVDGVLISPKDIIREMEGQR